MLVWALDGIEQIGPIDGYSKVEVVERDLATGAWTLEIPLDRDGSSIARRLADATKPGIELHDPDTGWRFGGYLRKRTTRRTARKSSVVFTGRDFQSLLANRLNWPFSTTPLNAWATIYNPDLSVTTVAHNTMYFVCGPGALSYRQIPNLRLGTDPNGGANVTQTRHKHATLIDRFRTYFEGSGYTYRLRLNRDEVGSIAPRSDIVFDTFERPTASIVLDTKLGNIGQLDEIVEANEATFVIAMGAEVDDGPERLVSVAPEGDYTDWEREYTERFMNRPSTDQLDSLAAEANNELAAARRGRSVVVAGANVAGFGRDVDLGWNIDVAVDASFAAQTVTLPVVGSKLTYSTNAGWRRTIDVASNSSALEGPAALRQSIADLERQLRDLESELRY